MIDIQTRLDEGKVSYNIWCLAKLVLPSHELINYSSDWVIIGTASSYNRAVFFANKYLEDTSDA
jgi:hypothetical protein